MEETTTNEKEPNSKLEGSELDKVSGGASSFHIGCYESINDRCPYCERNHALLVSYYLVFEHPVNHKTYKNVAKCQCPAKHKTFIAVRMENGTTDYFDMNDHRLM